MVDSSPIQGPSELLTHAEWLQRLARTLVRDDGLAEDLVQETWLSALRSGPRASARPRAWLAQVLQNHLRSTERSRARRARREAEVAPSELLPSTAELSERADSARVLLDAVLGLAEAQRQVLLLHYFEGLSIARIAALTGANEVAVRSRIARAVAALRATLERRYESDRARWLAALAPLANPSRVASTGALGAAALFGSSVMSFKSMLVVATAVVFLLGLGLRFSVGGGPGQRPVADSERMIALESGRHTRGEAANGAVMIAPSADASTRSALVHASDVDDQVPNASHTLSGSVIDGATRAPVAGARVIVQDHSSEDAFGEAAAAWELETDAQGEFHKVLHRTSVVTLEVVGVGYVPQKLTSVVVGAETEIVLRPAARLVVAVRLDRRGDGLSPEPIVGAACRLVLDGGNQRRRTIQRGTTDARGEVVFAPRNRQAHIIVEVQDQPSFVRIYELEPGQERLEVVMQPVGEVSGRVIDESTGQPIAGATLTALNRPNLHAITDLDGEFRIPNDHTENSVWTVTHLDYATLYQRIFAQSERVARVPDIQLAASAVMVGQLAGFEGETRLKVVSKQSYFVHQRFQHVQTLAGPGPVRVTGVPPGESLLLEARDSAGKTGFVEPRAAAPGETVDFGTLTPLATATLFGRVAGHDLHVPCVVRVRVSRGALILRDLRRAVHGTDYEVSGLPLGSIEAWLEQEGAGGRVVRMDPPAGATRLDLDLGGRIRGVVRDGLGLGVEGAIALVRVADNGQVTRSTARSDFEGRFVVAGLDRLATYHVSILNTTHPSAEIQPTAIENTIPEGPPLEFTLRETTLKISGTVSATILASVKAERLRVHAHCEGDRDSATIRDDGTFTISLPHPGPWDLRLLALDVGGEELMSIDLPGVNVIHDARPGVPVEFRHR